MKTLIYNGKVISPDGIIENGYVVFEGERITDVGNNISPDKFDGEKIDAKGNYVSPGFIDIHVHGGAGYRFIDCTREAVVNIAKIHAKHGTTTMFPTISALNNDVMVEVIANVQKYQNDSEVLLNIEGIHIEGPYFSKKQSGAQVADAIREPIESEYKYVVERFGSFIKRWSYAPENDGTEQFQKYLADNNIHGAIAHSDATYDDIMKLYPYGLKTVTHLYSCTSTVTRVGGFRFLGVIETAFLQDDFYVETIADGCHLPYELLKMIYKIKGDKRICLVTDATRYGGVDGDVVVNKNANELDFIIEDGVAKLPDRSAFAGSIATADRLVRTCVKGAGIPLESAIRMITLTPAELYEMDNKGRLAVNCDADIVIFDDDISIKKVIVNGKCI